MKTLVIGATGIIGNNIIRKLLQQGHDVVAMSRGVTPADNLKDLDVKLIQGDVTDRDSLIKAVKGVDWVFQAAPYYPRSMFHKKQHVDIALKGVRLLIEVLKQSSVQRLVYTSSLSTIGMVSKGSLANETMPYTLYGKDPHPYFLVKYLCEEELVKAVNDNGLPVVLVNPSGCFGPYEHKPLNLCFIPHIVNGKVPAFVRGSINVVDVADVAMGHVLAAQKGRSGERYILGGHNTTTIDLLRDVCDVAGVQAPKLIVPIRMALGMCLLSEVWALLAKKIPAQPALGIRFIQYAQHVSSDKAIKELGYSISPMKPCFEKAIDWYKKIGYC